MFEAVNAGWMDLGVEGTEHVAGTTSARDVFAAAQNAAKAQVRDGVAAGSSMADQPRPALAISGSESRLNLYPILPVLAE
jgi:hypothetical protein